MDGVVLHPQSEIAFPFPLSLPISQQVFNRLIQIKVTFFACEQMEMRFAQWTINDYRTIVDQPVDEFILIFTRVIKY